MRAYIRLLFVSADADGSRAISLARFGDYDCRLVELPWTEAVEAPLWVELYDHVDQTSIDSCRCCDLDQMVYSAIQYMARAKQLNAEVGAAHRTDC